MTFDDSVLKDKKHIHFIGIGGSGMYPLAQILKAKGYFLTGSDNNETDTLKAVRNMGIPVFLGHSEKNVEGADLIVHTAAIMSDNPELIAAKNSGALVLERSELLGIVCGGFSDSVCISGTHGKTTVSSMLTQIFMEADMDPSAVIGGKLPIISGSGRVGETDLFVCEACEYVDTFLKLSPAVSVILNIDEDHMEYFKTLDNLIASFEKFAKKATKSVIYNGDDHNTLRAIADIPGNKRVTFGYSDINDYYPMDISFDNPSAPSFKLYRRGEYLGEIVLSVPGKHNIINAVCACAVALEEGAKIEKVKEALLHFKGAARRFEILGCVNGATIADDYAHHPAELKVTLETAKGLGYNRVIAVFQPFTYSRTAILFDDFVEVLKIPDIAVLSEIMGSREKNTYNIYSSQLCEKIPGSVWFNTFEEIKNHVLSIAKEGDLIITLGCGDIYKAAKLMLE